MMINDDDVVEAMKERRGVTITKDDAGHVTLHWYAQGDTTLVHRDVLADLVDQINARAGE